MTPPQIVLLVVSILAVNVLLLGLALFALRARAAKITEALRAELTASGAKVLLGPTAGAYCGATGNYPIAQGNAMLALVEDKLLVRRLVGEPIDVPLAGLTAVRENKWFRGGYRSGGVHIICTIGHDEVGFTVRANEHAAWVAAIQAMHAR